MPKFCTNCGKPMEFENAEICPKCGVRIRPPAGDTAENRSAGVAAFLSFFFVGWGHWYNGRTGDGLKFFGAFLGCYLLMAVLAIVLPGQPSAGLLILLLLVLSVGIWLYGMYHAYRTTKRINRGELAFIGKSKLFWLPFVLILVVFILVIVLAAIAAFVFGVPQQSGYYDPTGYYPPYSPYRTIPTPVQVPYRPIIFPTVPPILPIPTIAPIRPISVPTYRPAPMPTIAPYRPVRF